MTLTYPDLGPAAAELLGGPLGCDPTGWPYQVTGLEHTDTKTLVALEPWPIPGPAATDRERLEYRGAMEYAGAQMSRVRLYREIG